MTDLQADGIDPNRPWILEPEDAPKATSWLPMYFSPFGSTSRVHFTRGWTALFFARLFVFMAPMILVAILASAGAGNAQAASLPNWGFPAFVLITALMSFNMHIRRLVSANRSGLWAVLVLVPVMAGLAGLFMGGMNGAQSYGKAVEVETLREDGLSDRQIAFAMELGRANATLAREVKLELELDALQSPSTALPLEAATAALAADTEALRSFVSDLGLDLTTEQASALAEELMAKDEDGGSGGSGGGGGEGRRGGNGNWGGGDDDGPRTVGKVESQLKGMRQQWRGMLPSAPINEVSEREFALDSGLGMAMGLWAVPAFFVMLWSLLWVGRLPNGGGRIKDRVADMRARGLN